MSDNILELRAQVYLLERIVAVLERKGIYNEIMKEAVK